MTIAIDCQTNSVVMDDVSWDYYSRTLEQFNPSRNVRITFDQGRMEIVTTSGLHERIKTVVARLIEIYSLEADVPAVGDGSFTLRREVLGKGLEPDECYYVQTPAPPALPGEFDLETYPPPDLAIEVEASVGSTPRQPIYAALGVREVWRFDGRQVVVLHLGPDGRYAERPASLAFPALPMDRFNEALRAALDASQHEAFRAFRDWVRASRS